jgi:putative heme transporter
LKISAAALAPAIRTIAALVVVLAIFVYFLPRIVDYAEVWSVVRAMTWLELATLTLVAAWNQATYWLVEVSGRPGLNYRQAMKITQSSTAMSNTLPGGAALGAGLQIAMYMSYGFTRPDIALSLTITGIWNLFVKLAMPIVAVVLLVAGRETSGPFVAASVVGLLVLLGAITLGIVVLWSEESAFTVGAKIHSALAYLMRLARRAAPRDWAAVLTNARGRAVELLRMRWGHLTAAVLLSHLSLYAVLLLSLRHVGVPNASVSWQEVLAAFAFVRLLSALPITPGGIGVVELGLVAALAAAGGNEARVVAAVLIYRVLTFVLPIPVGIASYFLWQREASRLKRPATS